MKKLCLHKYYKCVIVVPKVMCPVSGKKTMNCSSTGDTLATIYKYSGMMRSVVSRV